MIHDRRALAPITADGTLSYDLIDLSVDETAEPGTVLSNDNGTWSAYDGSEPASGVLVTTGKWVKGVWPMPFTPAADGHIKALVLTRHAELSRDCLIGLDADAEAALAARTLIVRAY